MDVNLSKAFERKPMKMNIWSILKDSIGKELYKLTVPVNFIEPLSMLQRLSENFQYAETLNKASKEIRGYMRLALVSAFCIGGFSYSQFRTLKFFNPLLGETFELMDSNLKFRFFSIEQDYDALVDSDRFYPDFDRFEMRDFDDNFIIYEVGDTRDDFNKLLFAIALSYVAKHI